MAIGAFSLILSIGIVAVSGDLLIRNKQITTISAVSFGLLLGLVIGALFSMALEPFLSDSKELAQPVRLFITMVCCYFFVSTLLPTNDDFRFIIPYVEFSKQITAGRPLGLDTTVVIAGRLAD